ncbi:cyclic nucleotide-binding/CBS domain-containing protein [Wenzhouxiangella sp. AB-CW3]|uniref:putative nucleotidyltransferase substrate binding domain-containing protein n=1 Tax=Wenzhouxiangella sp. AB-CW3 TaxID=2771012 RepID=UPI00168BEA67|nr:putative nucleotidyltransferase substrate binding domain-containing protein [Wenzhouxiangella sp. AB-CW3]QOC22441.1 cyclic nucleotide-binding/CBS domain-containing protein [Wenzhouxiangella sp. AB-CW3]
MEVEQLEVRDHLKRHPPFDQLPGEWLDRVAGEVEVGYFKAGDTLLAFGNKVSDLGYIRSGAVEMFRRDGELYNRLGEGELFGQLALMTTGRARFPVRAKEDTLVYFIPASLFHELFEQFESFADFVEVEDRTRLRQAAAASVGDNPLLTTRVDHLVSLHPVVISDSARVQQAAELMTRENISSVIVVAGEPGESVMAGDMVGVLTDSDLRRRVVAEAMSFETPVSEVMSSGVITIERDQFLFEALMVMLRDKVHHLPVLDRGRLIGLVDLSDIAGHESQSSLFVVRNILYRNSIEGLESLVGDVRDCFVRLVKEDANSHMIGSAMAGIGRAFKQRLLQLGEEALGPPPVPYCYLALGSMARDEQYIVTDQDNAMVLDDAFDPQQHDAYFLELARFVSDGLARLGYTYCKGDVMATNRKWRQPLAVWKQMFTDWIENPKPETLLHSSIFFDLDGVHGNTALASTLQSFIAGKASQSPHFLGCLARNAQNRTPPLGFFRDFVLEKGGRHENSINLKRRGSGPMVDVIRVHALAAGSTAQNSFRRLDDIRAAGFLTASMADDLRDALEFISVVRARHQAAAIEVGGSPNNNIDPETLSNLERRSLKDAFKVLANAQKFLKFRYRPGAR